MFRYDGNGPCILKVSLARKSVAEDGLRWCCWGLSAICGESLLSSPSPPSSCLPIGPMPLARGVVAVMCSAPLSLPLTASQSPLLTLTLTRLLAHGLQPLEQCSAGTYGWPCCSLPLPWGPSYPLPPTSTSCKVSDAQQGPNNSSPLYRNAPPLKTCPVLSGNFRVLSCDFHRQSYYIVMLSNYNITMLVQLLTGRRNASMCKFYSEGFLQGRHMTSQRGVI